MFGKMRRIAGCFALWLMAGGAPHMALADELPELQTCINGYVDTYEWLLEVHADTPVEEIEGGIWHVENVTYCGTLGIVRCDRSDNPIDCQIALRGEQDRLADTIRADLPDPGAVGEDRDSWPVRLYEAAHALAHGSSAGPDCAGSPRRMEVWCEARQASNRLRNAMHAWEIARYFGAVPPATKAGWAGPPAPERPRPRPE